VTSPQPPSAEAGAPRSRPEPEDGERPSWRHSRPATLGALVVGAVFAVLVGALVLWVALAHAGAPQVQVLDYSIHPRSVTIRFEVVKQADQAVSCVTRARSADGREVARELVPVPAGRGHVVLTHRLTTTARAVTVEVPGCTTH